MGTRTLEERNGAREETMNIGMRSYLIRLFQMLGKMIKSQDTFNYTTSSYNYD